MGLVPIEHAEASRERPVRVTGPVVIDLSEAAPARLDDEFVVEWQISQRANAARDGDPVTAATSS